jgi:cell wall-associated NlpC family hydrolase
MKTKPRKFYKIKSLFLFISLFSLIQLTSCSSTKKIRRQNINQVVETAKSYRGTPYRYGGTTRSGIDCSALIFHAFASVGLNMPRTSEHQSIIGKKVAK